ncbi:MAG: transglycosylase SLT domain-containing protein [Marinilabilia sp.]
MLVSTGEVSVHAQAVLSDDGEPVETSENEIEAFATSLDSLVHLWQTNTSATNMVVDTIPDNVTSMEDELSDSVYIQRLKDIMSPFKLTFNSHVKSYINLYTQKRREQVEQMLGLSEYYFPVFEQALDAHNLPMELKYLPVIESALNPRAFSSTGASGLWQLMYHTGKQYGLTVNTYVDERRDPRKSTEAAVQHLSDLYDIYQDWQLVIAAYNCGAGNVNRAIRRSGEKDFWEIFYLLPRETRGYVPAFIAATYTFHYHKEHDLDPKPAQLPLATDTVSISRPLHFSQVSEMMDIPVEIIRHLNPQYRRDIIPAQKEAMPLRLAFRNSTAFASIEDSIYQHQREKYFPNNQLVAEPGSRNPRAASPPPGKEAIYYTVQSGDAVGLIADWFDVYTSDLRYWTNIRRNIIRLGAKLVIYVDKEKAGHYRQIATQKSGQSASPQVATTGEDGEYIYHTVDQGDSIWSISKQYPDVSDSDIMRLNNISNEQKIKPGQKIKIKPKS